MSIEEYLFSMAVVMIWYAYIFATATLDEFYVKRKIAIASCISLIVEIIIFIIF